MNKLEMLSLVELECQGMIKVIELNRMGLESFDSVFMRLNVIKDLFSKLLKDSKFMEKNNARFKEIELKIQEFEYIKNGMHRLNGTSVDVRNIRIKGDNVIADVDLVFEERTENFKDLEYDLDKLLQEDKRNG